MPFNLLKKYPEFLDLEAYSVQDRTDSLRKIYKRDIENYDLFFRSSRIYPTKNESDGSSFDTHFTHLTTKEFDETDENGKIVRKRSFDILRSKRLHWVKSHIEELTGESDTLVFSNDYPSVRTYIWNKKESYVVILEPQRKPGNYYLLTAFYVDDKKTKNQLQSKYKNRLTDIK